MPAIYKVTWNGTIANSVPFVITHYYDAPSSDVESANRNAVEVLQELSQLRFNINGDPFPIGRALLAGSSNQCVILSTQVMSLYNPFDFAEVGENSAGIQNETVEGTAACYVYSSNRSRRDISRGIRYIPGVTASAYNANALTTPFRSAAITVTSALSTPIACAFPSGSAGNITPITLGSKYIAGTTDPREYARYPDYATQISNSYVSVWDGTGSYPKLGWLRGRAR